MMTKLPYKDFPAILADLERMETTVEFAEKLKEWLGSLQRTPGDVHGFSLSTTLGLDIDENEFDLERWQHDFYYTTCDVTMEFKDKSTEKIKITVRVKQGEIWGDILKAVRV